MWHCFFRSNGSFVNRMLVNFDAQGASKTPPIPMPSLMESYENRDATVGETHAWKETGGCPQAIVSDDHSVRFARSEHAV